jgi:hypothetical protein
MDEERLAEIEARCGEATAGPWDSLLRCEVVLAHGDPPQTVGALPYEDREFCSHAREDIPYLLARLREAEEMLAVACRDSHQFDLGRRAMLGEVLAWLRKHNWTNAALAVEVWGDPPVQIPPMQIERDNERLREAMRKIVAHFDDESNKTGTEMCMHLAHLAREALGETP